MRLNVSRTHEGAVAKRITPLAELRRSVLSCFLWEGEFYESGQSISERISELCTKVTSLELANLAVEARVFMHLRHAPLLLLTELLKKEPSKLVSKQDIIERVLLRADELCELVAVYWRNGKRPLSAQLKKGLAKALANFDEHQIAKYNRNNKGDAVKLRDVLRLVHPKAEGERSALYKRIIDGTLAVPDTWETALSAGADKRETFERLLRECNLGDLALLRNLRNMQQAGVDEALVIEALERSAFSRVYPFRFIAAARAVPQWEPHIDRALLRRIASLEAPSGLTAVLVDVSGSMNSPLSSRSDMTRADAAAALGAIFPGYVRLFSFSNRIEEVPPRRGMAGVDAILNSQQHFGTYLGSAVRWLNENVICDRLVVITDEQSHDSVPNPVAPLAYMINVASAKNGVGYGRWTHIDGFSENVLSFIREIEKPD